MPILSPQECVTGLPPSGRLIGIDHGSRMHGLALSDPGRSIASPLETIKRRKFSVDFGRLQALCTQYEICALIIGLPLNMDGSAGPRVQSVRDFGANVAHRAGLPVCFWDERLSSAAAHRVLLSADRSRARRAALVDKIAAAYILQGFLDWLGNAVVGESVSAGAIRSDWRSD